MTGASCPGSTKGRPDVAAFLNGYDMTGSHLTYQQVFHRETSLTRWGGGLEYSDRCFSYFEYLWGRAGGNGGNVSLGCHALPGLRRPGRRPVVS